MESSCKLIPQHSRINFVFISYWGSNLYRLSEYGSSSTLYIPVWKMSVWIKKFTNALNMICTIQIEPVFLALVNFFFHTTQVWVGQLPYKSQKSSPVQLIYIMPALVNFFFHTSQKVHYNIMQLQYILQTKGRLRRQLSQTARTGTLRDFGIRLDSCVN